MTLRLREMILGRRPGKGADHETERQFGDGLLYDGSGFFWQSFF